MTSEWNKWPPPDDVLVCLAASSRVVHEVSKEEVDGSWPNPSPWATHWVAMPDPPAIQEGDMASDLRKCVAQVEHLLMSGGPYGYSLIQVQKQTLYFVHSQLKLAAQELRRLEVYEHVDMNLVICPGCNHYVEDLPHEDGELSFCGSCHVHDQLQQRIETLERDLQEEVQNRDQAEAAADLMASLVLGEPIDWPADDEAWQRAVLILRDHKDLEAALRCKKTILLQQRIVTLEGALRKLTHSPFSPDGKSVQQFAQEALTPETSDDGE